LVLLSFNHRASSPGLLDTFDEDLPVLAILEILHLVSFFSTKNGCPER
jgi:hypothetical protein